MRVAVHLGVFASLLVAFAQAPFLHVHDHDLAHEHAQDFVHAHLANDELGSPAIGVEDGTSEARSLKWFAEDGKSVVRLVADMPESVALPEPLASPALETELIPQGHDPPWRQSLKARAPPA